MNLVRNCSHYSSIHTYVDDETSFAKNVRKVAFSREGARDLAREQDGISWYAGVKGLEPDELIKSRLTLKDYSVLVLKYWDGKIFSPYSPPGQAVKILGAILENYCATFGSCGFKYSHGDFSLGNHVLQHGEVCWIIDWEHFNDQLPRGYDMVYIILESFLFHYMQGKRLKPSAVGAGREILAQAQQAVAFDPEIVERPAGWLRETALKHQAIWGEQYRKLPFLVIPAQGIVEFDQLFRRNP